METLCHALSCQTRQCRCMSLIWCCLRACELRCLLTMVFSALFRPDLSRPWQISAQLSVRSGPTDLLSPAEWVLRLAKSAGAPPQSSTDGTVSQAGPGLL